MVNVADKGFDGSTGSLGITLIRGMNVKTETIPPSNANAPQNKGAMCNLFELSATVSRTLCVRLLRLFFFLDLADISLTLVRRNIFVHQPLA